jgi:hypothetical protein
MTERSQLVNSSTRRQFLRRSIAAFGLAVATAQLAEAQARLDHSRRTKLKISALSYSFRGLLNEGKMDVFGYLESCKYRYGLEAADLWSGFLPFWEVGQARRKRRQEPTERLRPGYLIPTYRGTSHRALYLRRNWQTSGKRDTRATIVWNTIPARMNMRKSAFNLPRQGEY